MTFASSTDPVQIEPADELYHAVHPRFINDHGDIHPQAFQGNSPPDEDRFSANLVRLSSPDRTLSRFRDRPRWKSKPGCVALISAAVCLDLQQQVVNTPDDEFCNPGHCDVIGPKDEGVQMQMLANCIPIPVEWTSVPEPCT